MFQIPKNQETFSHWLSEALEEIGVNKDMVLKRRRAFLLIQTFVNIQYELTYPLFTSYLFGSQIEGTTTHGLKSDCDNVRSMNYFTVIQDWCEWEPGVSRLLMLQDDNVSPGYCLLQCLRMDAPLPEVVNGELPKHKFRDRQGRILLENTIIHGCVIDGAEKCGPAQSKEGSHGVLDRDEVLAYPCKTWPMQARHWLNVQGNRGWPTDNMKIYCCNSRCFVVGVGRKDSTMEELEWRISTSEAERCLMFSLNITQIRCYVLMKMVIKTYVSSRFENSISSYMCKNVLFHCIAHTHAHIWSENNLLTCLQVCLKELYNFVMIENCPHFIIPKNNLMLRRFSPENKPLILEQLRLVINSPGRALLQIQNDSLGSILRSKFCSTAERIPNDSSHRDSGQLVMFIADSESNSLKFILTTIDNNYNISSVLQLFINKLCQLAHIHNVGNRLDKTACSLLAPRLCTTLGSVLASLNICHNNNITQETLTWLSMGLNSKVIPSKLKVASIFYCVRDTEASRRVLCDTDQHYNVRVVEPVCSCNDFFHFVRKDFLEQSFHQNEQTIQKVTAPCVIFLRCEIYCCPKELRYEMFRSTQEDQSYRGMDDYWMDWAVVDSLPCLYFLQYKNFESLGQYGHKQRALANLAKTIYTEKNLGHRETALNLLGQCMEQENRVNEAFHCYIRSRNIRQRNNAANWHICRLLATMINSS